MSDISLVNVCKTYKNGYSAVKDFNLDIIIKKREFKNNEAMGAAFVAQEQYIDRLLTT